MNIAVVDDIKTDSDLLIRLLREYDRQYPCSMTVSCYPGGEEFLSSLHTSHYDAVFLDIFMESLDGMETARRLWEADARCLVIFLTVSREHIWQAAGLHCFDYIDKAELTRERIFRVMTDLCARLPEISRTLDFVSGSRNFSIPVSRIQHILSDNNYTVFGMTDGTEYRCRISFKSICELTRDIACFLNCNRGILLNMDYIQREEADIYVMQDGQRFPIRRLDRPSIKNIYHNYQFEKLDKL